MSDHIFIDLEVQKGLGADRSSASSPIPAAALVRTNASGKVLASVAENAASFKTLYAQVVELCTGEGFVVVAVFPETKKKAFKDACAYYDLSDPFQGRAWLDFSQVAWPLAHAGHITNRSLRSVGEHFRITHDAPGTVTGDVAFLCATYWEMMRRYRTSLVAEEAVRELGGETLASIRKFVGF